MRLGGLQRTSLIDFPGLVAATVFTNGCNFRCPWCHNGSLIEGTSPVLDEETFFAFLERRRKLLDGVTVTGGEPTIQPDLPAFIGRIKALGLAVKLDTNGSRPDVMARLIDDRLIDYLALDVKAAPARYEAAAGVPVARAIIEEAMTQARRAPRFEFRLTLVPGLHRLEDADDYGRFLATGPLYIQAFRPSASVLHPAFRSARSFTADELTAFRDRVAIFVAGPVVLRSVF